MNTKIDSNGKKLENLEKELETEKNKNKILQKLVTEMKNKQIFQELTHIRKAVLKTSTTPPTLQPIPSPTFSSMSAPLGT